MAAKPTISNIPVVVLASFTLLTVIAVHIKAGMESLGASVPMLVLLAVYIRQRILVSFRND
jgi:hypothetical protein